MIGLKNDTTIHFFLIIGIAIFILMSIFAKNLSFSVRMAIAFGVFIVFSLIVTIWVLIVGDKPLLGAVTVYPEKIVEEQKETNNRF